MDERLVNNCLQLSRRQCEQKGISQATWNHIRLTGEAPMDKRGRPENLLLTQAILDFITLKPYLSTDIVALSIGCSRQKVSAVFKEHKLSFLWQRLRYADMDLKELDPDLIKARTNPLHVNGPGALVHIDCKRYGSLLGGLIIHGFVIHGFVVVDNYSGFTHLFLSPDGVRCGEWARMALDEFKSLFPATIKKVYSDNGTEFVNSKVLSWCENNGINHRTTKPRHAWSNGKAERTQSLLKREVLIPALFECQFASIAELSADIDHRLHWYNHHRVNGAKVNRGLPPQLVASQTAGLETDDQREEVLAKLRAEWQANARSQWLPGATK